MRLACYDLLPMQPGLIVGLIGLIVIKSYCNKVIYPLKCSSNIPEFSLLFIFLDALNSIEFIEYI